jgi:hypothetical protein
MSTYVALANLAVAGALSRAVTAASHTDTGDRLAVMSLVVGVTGSADEPHAVSVPARTTTAIARMANRFTSYPRPR